MNSAADTPPIHEPPNERIRPAFIEVNQRMEVLCSHVGVNCNYVNVGSGSNTGDADTIVVAAEKIADDLRIIDARVSADKPTADDEEYWWEGYNAMLSSVCTKVRNNACYEIDVDAGKRKWFSMTRAQQVDYGHKVDDAARIAIACKQEDTDECRYKRIQASQQLWFTESP